MSKGQVAVYAQHDGSSGIAVRDHEPDRTHVARYTKTEAGDDVLPEYDPLSHR